MTPEICAKTLTERNLNVFRTIFGRFRAGSRIWLPFFVP
nr:MAG TPA: hypothetical protein [Bacteriophage sp.]